MGIEAAGQLVEYEEGRIGEEFLGEGETTALTSREGLATLGRQVSEPRQLDGRVQPFLTTLLRNRRRKTQGCGMAEDFADCETAFGGDRPSVEPLNSWNEGCGGTLWEGRFRIFFNFKRVPSDKEKGVPDCSGTPSSSV